LIWSACTHVFNSDDSLAIAGRLREIGYTAVELLGEPKSVLSSILRPRLRDIGLSVSALTASSRLSTGRDLSSPDESCRRQTVDHYRACVDLAHELDCPVVGITLTGVGRSWNEGGYRDDCQRALDALSVCAEYARVANIKLGVEVLNRYASCIANTTSQTLQLLDELGSPQVGLALDLFHMNIEEANIPEAIKLAGGRLLNVHVTDSNRQGIGHGSLPLEAFMRALVGMDYHGPLACEAMLLPTVPVEEATRAAWRFAEEYLQVMPALERAVRASV
jgi:D-psicose/D-tagatose/L-ribulose 3-epimerase